VDIERKGIGRLVGEHAHQIEGGEHLRGGRLGVGGLGISVLHLVFQLPLRGGIEVRRVDLYETVEKLGDEIGL
jgi:hypothetical protein